ncbi:hypothetical protein SDC9_155495 [bioreactor metagenome]|uniref:Uncharacterized protein n=1 Tax=bioreactor metagenome TaxID=1076179 RepID=A0A645F6V4_9ZZZZ
MSGFDRAHYGGAVGRIDIGIEKVDRRIVKQPLGAEKIDRVHQRRPPAVQIKPFPIGSAQRPEFFHVHAVDRIMMPVIAIGMRRTNRAAMRMDVSDRPIQIIIDFRIGKKTAGEFRGVGIRIDADRQQMIGVVAAVVVRIVPVERMIFLAVKE